MNPISNQLPIIYSFRRCPYAIRARMAITYAAIPVELREILLRDKPEAMLAVSPKGTVPVLITLDSNVIDESLDVMHWAVRHNDPDGWLDFDEEEKPKMRALIETNDGEFKYYLDRYKYSVRYPEHPIENYRENAERFLIDLNSRLQQSDFLFGSCISFADIAIFPFIRQCSKVDLPWFQQTRYSALQAWLAGFEQSELFLSVMKKYKPWVEGKSGILFGVNNAISPA